MAELQGFMANWMRLPHLAQELMNDPERFLSARTIRPEDYVCPEEVHEALERGRRLGDAIVNTCTESEANKLPLAECVGRLRGTVAEHFGEDFLAEGIPFGILFKERAKFSGGIAPDGPTGTGSCTFCADNDSPDID